MEVMLWLAKITLWLMPSVLLNVTTDDGATTMFAGLYTLFWSETALVAIGAAGVDGMIGVVGESEPPPQAAATTSAKARRRRIIQLLAVRDVVRGFRTDPLY
jgi:hypothetical protein